MEYEKYNTETERKEKCVDFTSIPADAAEGEYTPNDSDLEYMAYACKAYKFTLSDILIFSKELLIDSKRIEDKGLRYIQSKAEQGQSYYQTILAGYYFYFDDTRKGLFWAEKSAEQGQTGSMKILGDAYANGTGVVQDEVEALKWYIVASSLGDLAAQGELLARGHSMRDSIEKQLLKKQAHDNAKQWMSSHRSLFIGN